MDRLSPITKSVFCQDKNFLIYDSDTRFYKCCLCGTGLMTEAAQKYHISGRYHRNKINESHVARQRFLDLACWNDETMTLNSRAKALGLQKWTTEAQSAILCSLERMHKVSAKEAKQCGRLRVIPSPTDQALKEARNIIDHFEQMERLSLLELAVWKALCTLEHPFPMMNLKEIRAWETEGWKAAKSRFRRHRGINIILSQVVPFLVEKSPSTYSPDKEFMKLLGYL